VENVCQTPNCSIFQTMMNEVFVLSTSKVKSIPGVKFFFAFVKLESVLSLLISTSRQWVSAVSLWSTFLDRPKMNEWILAFFTYIVGIQVYTHSLLMVQSPPSTCA
jgi:hypothetical protein